MPGMLQSIYTRTPETTRVSIRIQATAHWPWKNMDHLIPILHLSNLVTNKKLYPFRHVGIHCNQLMAL